MLDGVIARTAGLDHLSGDVLRVLGSRAAHTQPNMLRLNELESLKP